MQFDGTINIGHIFTALSLLAAGFFIATSVRVKFQSLETGLESVSAELKKMSGVLVELGRQDERLNGIDRRLDDLTHGRGFIFDPPGHVKSQG